MCYLNRVLRIWQEYFKYSVFFTQLKLDRGFQKRSGSKVGLGFSEELVSGRRKSDPYCYFKRNGLCGVYILLAGCQASGKLKAREIKNKYFWLAKFINYYTVIYCHICCYSCIVKYITEIISKLIYSVVYSPWQTQGSGVILLTLPGWRGKILLEYGGTPPPYFF